MLVTGARSAGSVAVFVANLNGRSRVPDCSESGMGFRELPFGWEGELVFRSNQLQYDWAVILCELLRGAPSGKPYKLSAMYLEFANTGDDPVAVPAVFDRGQNLAYYANLSGNRDYLRVPILAQTITSTDPEIFPPPRGNQLTNWAVTQGTQGQHGLEFSAAVGSRLYGAALVSTPDYTDPSQDLIYARFYLPENEQLVKLPDAQLGLAWPIRFL